MARSRVSVRIDGKTIAAATEFLRLILEAANTKHAPQPLITPRLDPYQLLGVPRNATPEQIRSRYYQLSQIFHPDKSGGDLDAMKRLNEAYKSVANERGMR